MWCGRALKLEVLAAWSGGVPVGTTGVGGGGCGRGRGGVGGGGCAGGDGDDCCRGCGAGGGANAAAPAKSLARFCTHALHAQSPCARFAGLWKVLWRGGGDEEGLLPSAHEPLLKLRIRSSFTSSHCSSTSTQAPLGFVALKAVPHPFKQQRAHSFLVSAGSCILLNRGCLYNILQAAKANVRYA